MTLKEWELTVPKQIREDTLWRVEAYRLGLFIHDLVWADATKLRKHPLLRETVGQLVRAVNNISSSVAEGYSRDTGRARSTYYEYSLGSAREARDWYYKGRRALPTKVAEHRIEIATQIIRLLL